MDVGALQVTLRRFATELLQLADQTAPVVRDGPGAKTHVLIDWENVQPDETECRALVPEATDIWLFHGPNQKNVVQRYGSFGERATGIRIARTGKNALDFHLSFYMGYIASRHPQARFVVLSNDKGYGPMLDHARELGFTASQSGFGAVKAAPSARRTAAKRAGASVPAPAKKEAAKAPAARKAALPKTAAARKAAGSRPPAKKAAAKKATPAAPRPAPVPVPAGGRALPARKSYEQVLANLRKSPAANRPRKHARLLGFVASMIGAEADGEQAEAMLARLVTEGKVAVDEKWTVSYRL